MIFHCRGRFATAIPMKHSMPIQKPRLKQTLIMADSNNPATSKQFLHGSLCFLPSGKRQQFAIENGPVEIVDLPMKNEWWIFP